MAEVIPFRGILYNASKVSGGDVIAPPYDIITPALRDALYGKSPYNIVRIDSGAEYEGDDERENKYVRAASFLEEWQRQGVLVRSERPCFYAYEMDYEAAEGRKRLHGLFGLVRLEELGKGVYPHEETHSKPKVDRLNLMNACKANTSPIFSLYNSPERKAFSVIDRIVEKNPYMEGADIQGAVHRIWPITEDRDIETIRNDLAGRPIFIADGHHRYETALEFQRIMGNSGGTKPHDYVLMFLANIADGGITILPTHRIIRHRDGDILGRMEGHFYVERLPSDHDLVQAMREQNRTFGLYLKGDRNQYILRYKGDGLSEVPPPLKELDVTVLHQLILGKLLNVYEILYEMDASVAKKKVETDYDAAFLLNPTKVEDVERVALSSTRMPPKSTYFYPKVVTGFVINSLKNSL